jgi:hypothetical protein
MPTVIDQQIRITDVEIVVEDDGYYVIVEYSDKNFDEFGPYKTYEEAEAAVY